MKAIDYRESPYSAARHLLQGLQHLSVGETAFIPVIDDYPPLDHFFTQYDKYKRKTCVYCFVVFKVEDGYRFVRIDRMLMECSYNSLGLSFKIASHDDERYILIDLTNGRTLRDNVLDNRSKEEMRLTDTAYWRPIYAAHTTARRKFFAHKRKERLKKHAERERRI